MNIRLNTTDGSIFYKVEDINNKKELENPNNSDISNTYSSIGNFITATESTSDYDIKKAEATYFNALFNISDKVTYLILHSTFEDGMTNPAIETVRHIFYRSPYIAGSWLSFLFSNNQTNDKLISGLLRIIATFEKKYSGMFIPMVRSGLSDKSTLIQEAAIMIIEEWRTKECLDALERTVLASQWVQEYANSVIKELKEELKEAC